MNKQINKENAKQELFAEVAFQDKQTFLRIYGKMPALKLKALANAVNDVIKQYEINNQIQDI